MKIFLFKFLFINLILIFFIFSKDVRINNYSYHLIVSNFKYDLIGWEIENIFDKWINKLSTNLFDRSQTSTINIVKKYFDNENQIDSLEISNNQNEIEEFIETTLSNVIYNENIDFIGGIQFPPVDIRLIELPKLLVISPRNKIINLDDVLIKPNITTNNILRVEEDILNQENLSAIILNIGGIATYPSSIPRNKNIKDVFIISAHEWMHHYLFFTKLGQNMFKSEEMRILNETLASKVSEELYIHIVEYLNQNYNFKIKDDFDKIETDNINTFNFRNEMMETRIKTELLLKENKIIDAENYMENQRLIFVKNGYNIRKLNQAYFAFYSSYADSSASNTTIGNELNEFRNYFPDLENYILEITTVSNYEEFKNKLYKLRLESR